VQLYFQIYINHTPQHTDKIMRNIYATIQKTSKTPKTIYLLSYLVIPIGIFLMVNGSLHPETGDYIEANIGLLLTLSFIPLRILSKFLAWWYND